MTPAPRDIAESAECLYDAEAVRFAIDRLAVRIALDLAEARPLVVCVMNGGLPFTAALLARFAFPLEVDYVHATRYRDAAPGAHPSGGELRIRVAPAHALDGRTVLLVDDVLDEGVTLERLGKFLEEGGASTVSTAVLVDKAVAGRTFAADYAALSAPDRYLVGWGMDYNGWYRNLPAIYALEEAPEEPLEEVPEETHEEPLEDPP